jgi:glycine hydroxymethyltransferase
VLYEAGIETNANSVPNDPLPPLRPSGIRIGTPAITTRGMKEEDCREVARLILDVMQALRRHPEGDAKVEMLVREQVQAFTARFPIYPNL